MFRISLVVVFDWACFQSLNFRMWIRALIGMMPSAYLVEECVVLLSRPFSMRICCICMVLSLSYFFFVIGIIGVIYSSCGRIICRYRDLVVRFLSSSLVCHIFLSKCAVRSNLLTAFSNDFVKWLFCVLKVIPRYFVVVIYGIFVLFM